MAQSVMSATDTLGHRDVSGLSATDPRPTGVSNRPSHYLAGLTHTIRGLATLNYRPSLIESKLQANASCECSRYNTPDGNTVYSLYAKNLKVLRPQNKIIFYSYSLFYKYRYRKFADVSILMNCKITVV